MYAADPLVLNLISRGAVWLGKHSFGGCRLAQMLLDAVPCAMTEPTVICVFSGAGRTEGSHTAWHSGYPWLVSELGRTEVKLELTTPWKLSSSQGFVLWMSFPSRVMSSIPLSTDH